MGLLCAALVVSCERSPILFQYDSVSHEAWRTSDTVAFQVPPQSADAQATLFTCVRTTERYPYRNLDLRVEVLCHDSCVASGAVVMDIFDDNDMPLGNGFPYVENERQAMTFPLTADSAFTVRIVHTMAGEVLEGVSDVGVKVIVF